MRVALITDGIWPYVLGGMQKHSFYICKYLAQNKIEVDLVHFNQSNYDIAKLEFFSEEERRFISPIIIDFPKSLPFPGHYLYNSRRYSKLVFNALAGKIHTYDFIYTKGFSGQYLIDQKRRKKISCAPVGVKFHGYEMFQKPPDLKIKLQHILLLRKPVREISIHADYVFSYGGKITDIIKSVGVEASKIVELPSGVETSAIAPAIVPSANFRRFLFLGRYERRKGIEELNQAILFLLEAPGHKNFEFQFIGPIPADKQIQNQNVIYHGEIRSKDGLQLLMRKCDVLICPSWSEGMPNVILEAMANGLAVIATGVGATNVLVNDETGWLLQSSDPAEIKTAIDSAIAMDVETLNTKKSKALERIKTRFTWEKLSIQLVDFFKKTI